MKTSRYILIVAAGLMIGFSDIALARPNLSIGFSFGGRPNFNRNCRPDYKFNRNPRHFRHARRDRRPHGSTIIIGGGCRYDRRQSCYIATSPIVVERPPVIVEKQTVVYSTVVQPQQFDQSTLQLNMELQYKKSELLKQLQMPNKELRRQAIRELAGFSFDDNVRYALEKILLSDPDPELRAEAADAFGKAKNANARPALEKARVEDSNADVRRAADSAIKSIEGN